REYRLAYETSPASGRSRVATLSVCGLAGECLPPTQFTWLDGAPGWARESAWDLPRQLWRETRQEGVLGDIDGDGRLDLIHGGNATQTRASWLNTGDGFASASDWRPPDDLFSATLGLPHALLADLDGDGLPEYVRSFRAGDSSLEIATYLNEGDGWRSAPTSGWATPTFIWDYKDDHPQQTAVLVDVNGDGLPDWVKSYESQSGTEHRETRLNTGAGFGSPTSRWNTPVRLFSYKGTEQQTEATLVDLNGDALPDLVQAYDDQSGQHRGVWLNTGSGFAGPVAAWLPPRVIWDYEHDSPRQEAELVDVNADGLVDFVVAFKGNTGGAIQLTWLNTGAGWLRDAAWDLPTFMWNYENAKNRQTAQLADVNGDGFPDLVRAHVSSDGVDRRDTWLNTGRGFPSEWQSDPA
ncbi:MAG: FG-GAP repeat domain-containing protein, partial [Myxococcota bacterium]